VLHCQFGGNIQAFMRFSTWHGSFCDEYFGFSAPSESSYAETTFLLAIYLITVGRNQKSFQQKDTVLL
jgi:hypothetical protein